MYEKLLFACLTLYMASTLWTLRKLIREERELRIATIAFDTLKSSTTFQSLTRREVADFYRFLRTTVRAKGWSCLVDDKESRDLIWCTWAWWATHTPEEREAERVVLMKRL
jgi:hypothetical protein